MSPGKMLAGDVDFDEASRVAVPGGVGLLTVAMLLRNTFGVARLRRG